MPDRARVKYLMTKIIDEQPMTPEEYAETEAILKIMKDYKPGISPDPGFPVKPSDSWRASLMLASFKAVPVPIRTGEK